MSTLSDSLATVKDRSQTTGNLMTPSNSISLSTTSNRSTLNNDKKSVNKDRNTASAQNSSSKKTFILNKTKQQQSLSKLISRKT